MPYPTYDIATETLTGALDAAALHSALDADASIPSFSHIERSGPAFTVVLTGSPSGAEQAAVDAAAAAHAVTNKKLKLNRFTDQRGDHREIDYKTGLDTRLEQRVTDSFRGEVREVEYHVDATFSDLVLKTNVVYSRAVTGLANYRDTTRTWYREDGTEHPTKKQTRKTYSHDPQKQMGEGRRRRQNLIDNLTVVTLQLIAMTETAGDILAAEALAIPWIATYEGPISNFIRSGDLTIRDSSTPNITNDTNPWLDNVVDGLGLGYPAGWTLRTVLLDTIKGILEP